MDWRRLSLAALLAPLARPVAGPGPTAEHGSTRPGPATAALGTSGDRAEDPGSGGRRSRPVPPQPVTLGGARVVQVDQTTCGSTVLLMLAATGDPVLARWLETGELPADLPPHRVPPEIPRDGELRPARPHGAAERMAAAQQHIKARTVARALGLLPWPAGLGTPPWTAAREARFPGVRYQHLPLDDAAPGTAPLLAATHAATLAGTPVPLYAGGDLGRGVATAVPRHVVLAVPPPAAAPHRGRDGTGNPVLHLYEPSGGHVHQVPIADLLGRSEPHPALGGWSHVAWVLLPRRRSGGAAVEAVASARGRGQAGEDRRSSEKEEP
ncbi:hypothetical protein [Georgenia alba]|uniref:Peptidase C39-like domain-containing protein n=1 Tax=Georgenia alba TaxID=2233858 RepID=A0ABW2QBG8_9MICO